MQIHEQAASIAVDLPPGLVAELVAGAWELVVGDGAYAVDDLLDAELDRDGSVDASISIGGPWQASVLLRCTRAGARLATSRVLGIALDELDDADVHDVMGEMANIVGGNLKGVVSDDAEGWTLSLPVVSASPQHVPGSRRLVLVDLLSGGEALRCEVREIA
jgi:chemotaxis protein CheX